MTEIQAAKPDVPSCTLTVGRSRLLPRAPDSRVLCSYDTHSPHAMTFVSQCAFHPQHQCSCGTATGPKTHQQHSTTE